MNKQETAVAVSRALDRVNIPRKSALFPSQSHLVGNQVHCVNREYLPYIRSPWDPASKSCRSTLEDFYYFADESDKNLHGMWQTLTQHTGTLVEMA